MYKNKEKQLEYMRDYNKKWYDKNKVSHKATIKENKEKYKVDFYEYKSSLKCGRCSETHVSCLDFHHKDGEEKERGISSMIGSCKLETIMEEIKKCEVVCANCHRKIHWNEKSEIVKLASMKK